MVDGNRYLQWHSVGEVVALDEAVSGLTVSGLGGGNCIKCGRNGKNGEEKILKKRMHV